MKIECHWLKAENKYEKILRSVTLNAREVINPIYLIIHYTAGDTAKSAVNWFINTTTNTDKISAHIIIETDGTIIQLVPFNRRANHAGSSTWDGVDNLNLHSIGVELVNPGSCEKQKDGTYKRKIAEQKYQVYPRNRAKDIVETRHKHQLWAENGENHWFKFPVAQLIALYNLSRTLIRHYDLKNVLGHDDISPYRKPDPGPCFPWHEYKMNVLGKSDNIGEMFIVNTEGTSLRKDHSTHSSVLKTLSKGYNVGLIETLDGWCKVYLANERMDVLQNNCCVKTIGWIQSSLLTLKES